MFLSSKICLVILDGWGIGKKDFSNPIYQTGTPYIDFLKQRFPFCSLQASGIAVGLPWQEEGNSEVGHLTMGIGTVIYQYFPRITMSIEDGSFFDNEVLQKALLNSKEKNSACHFLGLLSSGSVHSHYSHLLALIKLAKKLKVEKLNLHLFTDGKDSPPQEALIMLQKLKKDLINYGVGKIASVGGRFFAMDRDSNYHRTQRYYNLLTEGTKKTIKEKELEQHLRDYYNQGITDEFIEPTLVINTDNLGSTNIINDGDTLIFFNFREDSMRQLVEPFLNPEFKPFPVKRYNSLSIVTFTQYRQDFEVAVAFPAQKIETCLAGILSQAGKRQLHLAESEKYSHITFFFNGLRESPFPGEYWVIVPSLKILHHEEHPELQAEEITSRLFQAFGENVYDFILVNYANPDIIGHTGNLEAAAKVVKVIDEEIKKVVEAAFNHNYTLIITSDHGNLERMLDPYSGEIETEHDFSPVPFYLIDKRWQRIISRAPEEINAQEKEIKGTLADIAPTILELFGLPVPETMTGKSLLKIITS